MAKCRWAKRTCSARWHMSLKNAAARRKPKIAGRQHMVAVTVIKQHIYAVDCPVCQVTNKFMPSGNLIEWCTHMRQATIAGAVFIEP